MRIHTRAAVASALAAVLAAGAPSPARAETAGPETTTETTAAGTTGEDTVAQDAAIEAIDRFIADQDIDRSAERWRTDLPKPEPVSFEADTDYFWVLDTELGRIRARLLTDVAPMHATSTIYLTRLGFYDGLTFHRIIPDFMAQGGDPLGTGTGGPGYTYGGEFARSVRHDRPGLLSMANAGPGTDGSQFFLTFVETPWLDGKHTIFGRVVDGMDVLEKLEALGTRSGRPTERVAIREATIQTE